MAGGLTTGPLSLLEMETDLHIVKGQDSEHVEGADRCLSVLDAMTMNPVSVVDVDTEMLHLYGVQGVMPHIFTAMGPQ